MLQNIDITSLTGEKGEFVDYDPLVHEYGFAKSVSQQAERSLKKMEGLGQECALPVDKV